jgi:hypothetical protein
MPTKRKPTKRKTAKRKSSSKRKTSGLTKYRSAVKKATKGIDKTIRGLESRLKKAKATKKARTKKATVAYRKKHK